MADVRPFRGLRFDPERVGDLGRVLCPPYDVIDADDERRYLDLGPYNAVRLELSKSSAEAGADDRYARAADTLRAWRDAGVLVADDVSGFFLHEAAFGHAGRVHVRRELIAAVRLEQWDRRVVLPHERTYDRPKADRLRLLDATGTNISPILMFFQREADPDDVLAAAWSRVLQQPLAAAGSDLEGVEHRIWDLRDPDLVRGLTAFFAERPLFIADGHHRYETALAHRAAIGELPPEHPANYVMAHLIAQDDPGLVILPIHRLLRGLDGLGSGELDERLSRDFQAEYVPIGPGAPAAQVDACVARLESRGRAERVIGVYGPDLQMMAILSPRNAGVFPAGIPTDRDPTWQALDVVLADEGVIRPLLAERGLAAEDQIDYTRDAHEAFAAVQRGEQQIAVLLNPTRPEQVAAVALAGERMPQKSTYFYPKAPTGLVFRPIA